MVAITSVERQKILKLRSGGKAIHAIASEMHRSTRKIREILSGTTIPKKKPSTSLTGTKITKTSKPKDSKRKLKEERNVADSVLVEHRSVIKFLSKKGLLGPGIYDEMHKVYGDQCPKYQAIQYWATQYKSGRETIINEPHRIKKFLKNASVKGNILKKAASKKKIVALKVKLPPKKTKKPSKTSVKSIKTEGKDKIRIKLPGLFRK